jgi:hypothetical protein
MTVTDGPSGGSSYTQTRGSLNVGTGWDVFGGSTMTLTDMAISSGEAGLILNGSTYTHTGGSVTTGQRFEVNASTAILDGVSVTTQNGAGIIVANGATFDQSGGSLTSAEILRIDGGSTTAAVENADVSAATDLQVRNAASYSQTNNALSLGGNLEVSGGSSAVLNNVSASSNYANVVAGSGLTATGGSLDVGTKLTVDGALARYDQSAGAVLRFGDEIFILDGGTLASDGSTIQQSGTGRGDVLVTNGSTLDLKDSIFDNTAGSSGWVTVSAASTLTITDGSAVNARSVRVQDATSQGRIQDSSLTTQTLDVLSGASWDAIDAEVVVTGNTTTVDAGSSLSLTNSRLDEAGDLTVNGILTGSNSLLEIGGDLIIGSLGSIDLSSASKISVGDDFIADAAANSDLFALSSTTLTMLGLADDDDDGFNLGVGSLLDTLIVSASQLILQQNLTVNSLLLDVSVLIDLNGYNLMARSAFNGDLLQIVDRVGGGSFQGPTVPAPAPLFLIGTGVLGGLLARKRERLT